eukprot:Phypoly_transcript_08066.p1 GENE.Phypoly_transcript_08066~~Phypoly_transcript_08066.p1  ORF type:complete len:369 (+),score=62.35 Phypoly_transcript_08066:407-1513(+)
MKFIQLAILLGALFYLASGDYITSWELDKRAGQIYAVSGSWLYELDNVLVQQNNVHQLNFTTSTIRATTTASSGSHIRALNGQRSLLQLSNDWVTGASQVGSLDLPFNNRPVLIPSSESASIVGGGPIAFNDKDSVILTVNKYNLTLIDMNTLAVLDSINVYSGLRRLITSVLYNQKTNRAVVFWYKFDSTTHNTQLQVSEFDIVNNQLVEAVSTFPQDSAQFSNSELVSAAFDASSNKYWALDQLTPRLVSFKANNLATPSFVSIGDAEFINTGTPVALYNFGAQLAYVVSSNTAVDGYHLQEIDLASGAIRRSRKYSTGNKVPFSAFLDIGEGNVYIGLGDSSTTSATIAVVDLANFSQQLITLSQ